MLNESEKGSSTWKKVKEEIQTRVAFLDQKNRGALSWDDTLRVREEIRALESLVKRLQGNDQLGAPEDTWGDIEWE